MASCQERMYALRADSIKNATSKQSSTNPNSSNFLYIFVLQTIADQNGGFICMHTGGVNADDWQCCYIFEPNEIFL